MQAENDITIEEIQKFDTLNLEDLERRRIMWSFGETNKVTGGSKRKSKSFKSQVMLRRVSGNQLNRVKFGQETEFKSKSKAIG